jgi:hypothetical protein
VRCDVQINASTTVSVTRLEHSQGDPRTPHMRAATEGDGATERGHHVAEDGLHGVCVHEA